MTSFRHVGQRPLSASETRTEIDPQRTSALEALWRVRSRMRPPIVPFVAVLVAGLGACATTPVIEMPISAERVIGKWSLTRVGGQSVSRAMTMDFGRDGLMLGTSRCNSMSGSYEVRPPTVVFPSPVIITTAGCGGDYPPNERAVELAERILFADPTSGWSISSDGQRLVVHGEEELRFARQR